MRKIAAFFFVFSVFAWSGPVAADTYKIDPAHASIQWRVQHLGVSTMVGRFNPFSGIFTYDSAEAKQTPTVEIEIEMALLDSNHALRDKHLRADFFETAKYPTASFKSTSYSGNDEHGTLTGLLTMHGVTREVSVEVRKTGEGKDPWGTYRAGFEGTARFDRRDFGIDRNVGPSSWLVDLEVIFEGIRQ
jgi:polyisoprenoid-binding protein YceI